MAQHISQFNSLGPGVQDDTLHFPKSHGFQVIIQTGDTLSDGTIMPENIDFCGFMQKDKDPNEGWLSINNELDSGSVIILDLIRNLNSGLWEVEHAEGLQNINLLGGTSKNCSGQVTPWKTFISCEETVSGGDSNNDKYPDFGWCFEIDPLTRKVMDYDMDGMPDKLWEMGRMYHENIAIASDMKTVYYGDDREHSGFVYKFVCDSAMKLNKGNAYVLQIISADSAIWIPLQDKDPVALAHMPGFANLAGATHFKGVEDIEIKSDGRVFFSSKFQGAVFSFIDYGTAGVHMFDTLLGPKNRRYEIVNGGKTDTVLFRSGADNIAIDNNDNLWLLQDELHMTDSNYVWVAGQNHSRQSPDLRIFGRTADGAEPSGISFTPSNSHLFMSVMHPDTNNVLTQKDIGGKSILFNRSACISVARTEEFLPEQKINLAYGSSACLGDSLILTVRESDRFQFQWYRDSIILPTKTDTFIVVRDTANYWCTLTGPAGVAYTDTFSSLFVPKPHSLISLTGPALICSNDFTSLTANKDSNWIYSWRFNAQPFRTDTFSQIYVNGAGNYDVVVNDRHCFDTSNVVAVQHKSIPNPQFRSSRGLDACLGDSVELFAAFYHPANQYKWWQNQDSTVFIGDTSLVSKSSSLFQLIVDAPNGCSDTSQIAEIEIHIPPNPSLNFINDSSFCQGSGPILKSLNPNLKYQWFRNGDSLLTDTIQSVAISITGEYNLHISDQFGCTDSSALVEMTLDSLQNAILNHSGLTPICVGNQIKLEIASKPWASYQWLLGGTPIGGATSNVLTTGAMGTYQIISANSSNTSCRDTSGYVTVSVHNHPQLALDTIRQTEFCNGDSVSLRWNTFGEPGNWDWFRNMSILSLEKSDIILIRNSGNYHSVFTSFAGCLDTSIMTSTTNNPLPNNKLTTTSTDTSLCLGNSLTLTSQSSGLNYQWRRNGSILISETSRSITTSLAGNYSLDLLSSKGCANTSALVQFTTDSVPNIQLNLSGPTSFCVGSSITLSKIPRPWESYQWYRNGSALAGQSNSQYDATNNGLFHLLAYNSQNPVCRDSTTPLRVTVYSKPELSLDTIGTTSLCDGDSLILRGNSNGRNGTWDWRRNGALVKRSTSPELVVFLAGQYTAYFTDSNSCSENLAATTVSVLSRPSVDLRPSATSQICQGDSLRLYNNLHQSGTNYIWYRDNIFLAGEVNRNIMASQNGLYHFVAKAQNGCTEESSKSQLTVYTLPSAELNIKSSDTSICAGSTLLLESIDSTLSYVWYFNQAPLAGQVSKSLMASNSGSYQLKVSDANSCSKLSQNLSLKLDSMPDVEVSLNGPLSFCSGDEVGLTASYKFWARYQWYDGNILLPGDSSFLYMANSPGSFKVIMQNEDNESCKDTSSSFQVSLFPNPQIRLDTIGVTKFCDGDSVLLRASSFGHNGNWSWKDQASTVIPSATDSALFIKNSIDLYTVFTDGNGCKDSTITTHIVSHPLPNPQLSHTDTSRICLGDTLRLQAISSVLKYSWYKDDILIPASVNQSLEINLSGLYRLELEDSNSCKSISDDLFLTTDSLPNATVANSGSLSFCENDSVILRASYYPWAKYQWLTGGFPLSTDSTSSLTSKSSSNFQLVIWNTVNSSCRDTSLKMATTRWSNPVVVIDTIGSSSFCSGDSVILKSKVNSAGFLRWRLNSQPIGSINDSTITAFQSGIYTSQIIDTNFCVGSDTVEVFRNDLPQVRLLTNGTEFCYGDSMLINKTTSPVSSFNWYRNGTLLGSLDSLWQNNSALLKLWAIDSNNCENSDSLLLVERKKLVPLIIPSKPNICLGDSVVLSPDKLSYQSYNWFETGTLISQDTSISVSSIGTYTFAASDDLGCLGTSDPYILEMKPIPVTNIIALGNTTFCFGDSVQLISDSVRNDFNYQWYSNGIAIPFSNVSSISAKWTAYYSLSIADSNSCFNRFDSIPIRAKALPLKPLIMKVTDTLRTDSAHKYQWFLNDTAIANSNTPWIIGFVDGNYQVVVTDTMTGCSISSSIFSYSRNMLLPQDLSSIKIYPNPGTGVFSLNLGNSHSSSTHIEILSSFGSSVKKGISIKASSSLFTLDLTDLSAGVYFVKIHIGDRFVVKPIIIKP